MAVDVIVPLVGEVGMEVTFVGWLKGEGDAVRVGEPLFEIDTAKATLEIEAFADGTLVELTARAGDLVTPHQVVARIIESGGSSVPGGAAAHVGDGPSSPFPAAPTLSLPGAGVADGPADEPARPAGDSSGSAE